MQIFETSSELKNNNFKKKNNTDSIEIDHIGIAVKSIKKALPFYESLKLKPSFETVSSEKVRVAFFTLNNKADIELLEPTDTTSIIHKFLEKRGEGLHHICLRVKNLEKTLKKMQAENVKLIDTKPRIGAKNCKVAFVHPKAANGVLIELSEKLKEDKQNVL